MADEQTTEGSELRPAEVGNPNPQTQPETHPDPDPQAPSRSTAARVGNFISGFFKRNGRHPENCQCPIHRKPDVPGRFDPPVGWGTQVPTEKRDLPGTAQPGSFTHPVQVLNPAPNPARFEIWGRLAKRVVKTVFGWLTEETPAKAIKLFGPERGSELVADLKLEDAELADVESASTRLAMKYNLTTGYDEELELAITLGSIFGRVIRVNRKLDRALAELEKLKPANP